MATVLILPIAFVVCGFFSIACTIDKYVRENHS